jgi:hypothetical protein
LQLTLACTTLPAYFDRMFVTESAHEMIFPSALISPESRNWRVVGLALHVVWFVLTVEVMIDDDAFDRTACVASDVDLVDVLDSLEDGVKPVSLLCMMPGWCSPTGQWSSRQVVEVWEARSRSGPEVILVDGDGVELKGRMRSGLRQARADRRLVLRLGVATGQREAVTPNRSSSMAEAQESES